MPIYKDNNHKICPYCSYEIEKTEGLFTKKNALHAGVARDPVILKYWAERNIMYTKKIMLDDISPVFFDTRKASQDGYFVENGKLILKSKNDNSSDPFDLRLCSFCHNPLPDFMWSGRFKRIGIICSGIDDLKIDKNLYELINLYNMMLTFLRSSAKTEVLYYIDPLFQKKYLLSMHADNENNPELMDYDICGDDIYFTGQDLFYIKTMQQQGIFCFISAISINSVDMDQLNHLDGVIHIVDINKDGIEYYHNVLDRYYERIALQLGSKKVNIPEVTLYRNIVYNENDVEDFKAKNGIDQIDIKMAKIYSNSNKEYEVVNAGNGGINPLLNILNKIIKQ